MNKVTISLSVEEIDALKLLVKEKMAIWRVRLECANTVVVEEHCRFEMAMYNSLLKSLEC